jgi:hypothetical protein
MRTNRVLLRLKGLGTLDILWLNRSVTSLLICHIMVRTIPCVVEYTNVDLTCVRIYMYDNLNVERRTKRMRLRLRKSYIRRTTRLAEESRDAE